MQRLRRLVPASIHPGLPARAFGLLLLACLLALGFRLIAGATVTTVGPNSLQIITSAQAVKSDSPEFPEGRADAQQVSLPDDWWSSRPRDDGPVWYRIQFNAVPASDQLLAVYIERACTNAELHLNGAVLYIGRHLKAPVTRNCFYPQLVSLPSALLKADGNVLDIKVHGVALQQVGARQRSGGLSEIRIGPQQLLGEDFDTQFFWNITVVQLVSVGVLVLGIFIVGLGWINRRETHLLYFGLLTIGWVLLSSRLWLQSLPFDNGTTEFIVVVGFAALTGLGVQFLLSYATLRSRTLELCLLVQCLAVPATIALAGPNRLFVVSCAWSLLMAFEIIGTIFLFMRTSRHDRRREFWPMALILVVACLLGSTELAIQYGLIGIPRIHVAHFAIPLVFAVIGAQQLRSFGNALKSAEASRNSLESRVAAATAEMERNYAQMAELRVEQVTEKERKRIAGDLHDDLGAKLLTIVHTSESERISTLAREALEEMRLSVRGLTGKPLPAADALADWRAETVSRLGQAGIEADWRSPAEEVTQLLSARAFVQTTRILREAISNVIKHSGASHCKVRCTMGDQDFILVVQDNGKGIPMELDGKLDRGHGMASMKHRAKQMQGQCLVESGPGYGTVIRLTLPLGTA